MFSGKNEGGGELLYYLFTKFNFYFSFESRVDLPEFMMATSPGCNWLRVTFSTTRWRPKHVKNKET